MDEEKTYDSPEFAIKIGHSDSTTNLLHVSLENFATYVFEETKGRVKVDIYASEQLGSNAEMSEMVSMSTLDAVLMPQGQEAMYAPRINALGLPFLFAHPAHQPSLHLRHYRVPHTPADNSRYPKVKGKATAKTGKKAVKDTKKTIKTSRQVAKRTAKTVRMSVKAAKKAAVAAKKAAQVAAKVAKVTAKAIATAVKAAIAAIKGLIAAIAAGGWVVIVIILVIALIALLVSSPWGVFFEDTDENTPTISELVIEINNDYSKEITSIISDAGDIDEIIMDGDTDTAIYEPNNWIDVIGIFAVKTSANPNEDEYMDVLIMDENKVNILKDVFWGMNTISYEIIEEEIEPAPTPTQNAATASQPNATPSEPTQSPTPEPTPKTYRILIISVESLTYAQAAKVYSFDDNQNELLSELMSVEYYSLFMEICGMDSFNGLTPEQAAQLINELPEGELGADIVRYAISRLGDPYSRPKRGQGSYVDCSYLARWCYQQAGVDHFTAGTAAEQARYCVNNRLAIAESSLQAGDLVFWSFNTNGRYLNITHVGIYVGDGMVIDASSSRGMVVYRELFGESSIIVCGRPHVK